MELVVATVINLDAKVLVGRHHGDAAAGLEVRGRCTSVGSDLHDRRLLTVYILVELNAPLLECFDSTD